MKYTAHLSFSSSFIAAPRSLRRSRTRYAVLAVLLSLALQSAFDISHAASPPELTLLRQQYEKSVAERVTAPYEAGLTELNAKFITALDRAITEAKQAGDLKTVIALEDEKKRLADEAPLPSEDEDSTPEALKKLRPIYRDQLTLITTQRSVNHAAILPAYTTNLEALEATLTKNDRVEEAKEVLAYREGLALGQPVAAQAPAPPAATPPGGTSPMEKPVPVKTSFPKGDDRKAAEWVLSVGGSITIKADGGTVAVDKAASLPTGRFEVIAVRLKFFGTAQPAAPITDLLPLAGLQSLQSLDVATLPDLKDEHLLIVRSLPALQNVTLSTCDFTDDLFVTFAEVPALNSLMLRSLPDITGTGLGALAKVSTLTKVELAVCTGLRPEGLRQLGQLSQVQALFVDGSTFTDADLAALDSMKELRDFQAKHTSVSLGGIASRKALSGLKVLALTVGAGELASQVAAVAKTCPAIDNLILTGKNSAGLTADDVAALKEFPKLRRLMLYSPGVTEATVAGVAALPNLESFSLGYLKLTDACLPALVAHKSLRALDMGECRITAAGLQSLVEMKALRLLDVKDCPALTPAGIAAFKKQRPDVKFE